MAFVQLGRYYTYNFSKCITRSQIDKGQIIIDFFWCMAYATKISKTCQTR